MAELGKNLVVHFSSNKVGLSRSCSFTLTRDTVDTSTKDQNSDGKEYGRYRASISTEHLIDFSDTSDGVFSADDALLQGTKVTASWSKETESTGDISYSGSFLVTQFDLNADDNAPGTVTIALESDGDITRTVAA